MLFYNDTILTSVYLYSYMLIYNLTLILVFWVLSSVFISQTKTINSFSGFNLAPSSVLLLSISLFSIAGVPPFTGFLAKLFVLNLLINQKLAYLYFLLFVLLFVGLYFYVQNMRFLHSSNYESHKNVHLKGQVHLSTGYACYAILLTFFLVFGVFFVDDLLLFNYWLFS